MEKYKNIENCQTETKLFELWKAKKSKSVKYQEETFFINHKNVFISDGIVNKEVWNSHNGKKILYVLKEAYGENEDWSLTEWILHRKPSSSVWKRVIEWTYGIQNTNADRIARYSSDIYELNTDLFNQIAVVNLKKVMGNHHQITKR